MKQKVVLVDKYNYQMFDDMIFYRANGRYKSNAELNVPHDFTEQYAILENDLLITYAVEVENKFVGYISIVYIPKIGKPNNNGYIFIEDLWINPDYRRLGFAEVLMKAVEGYAQKNNIYGLRLYVSTDNNAGMALYKKCGFTNPFGEAMLMERVF